MNVNLTEKQVSLREIFTWREEGKTVKVDDSNYVYVNQCYRGRLI